MEKSPKSSDTIRRGRSQTVGGEPSSGNARHQDGKTEAMTLIAEDGDLIVGVQHDASPIHLFRVSTAVLRAGSNYCERLLHPGRFGEGSQVEAAHKRLREQYRSLAEVPSDELPVVIVKDLGRISAVKALDALCADLFNIMHSGGKNFPVPPPVVNLANVAIAADRFDALDVVKSFVRRKKVFRAIDGKTTAKMEAALGEERVRQRLLVAIMLDHPPWVERYSTRLVIKGWVGKNMDISTPLWFDLPSRFEEELAYRRDGALETIQSLQSYFLGLYTSRDRQCKLGYDSSPQCDSFQLGEMIRFFKKAGTLQLQGSVLDTAEPSLPYEGDIYALLDTLRQAPEYQIDRNHAHCGIRTRIIPSLDFIQAYVPQLGICSECWVEDRASHAWIESKRPLLWKKHAFGLSSQEHVNRHAELRAMFTAVDRDWSS